MTAAALKRVVANTQACRLGHLSAEVRTYVDGGREAVLSFEGRPIDWLNLTITPETAHQLRNLARLCDGAA